jgi:hypothetical protein
MSQGDNQNSYVALSHVVLNEWLVSRQSAFTHALVYGGDLAAVFIVVEYTISVRGKHKLQVTKIEFCGSYQLWTK